METLKTFASTELLTKAFIQVSNEIKPASPEVEDAYKALSIAEPIAEALDCINDFGLICDKELVNLIDTIKHHCKGAHNENKINNLCSNVLMLALSANKYYYLYGKISKSVQAMIDTEREKL